MLLALKLNSMESIRNGTESLMVNGKNKISKLKRSLGGNVGKE
jgi:hypothetical protein